MRHVLRCFCVVLGSGLALSMDVYWPLPENDVRGSFMARAMPLAGAAEVSHTDATRRLGWEDLTPPFDDSKDPFKALNEEQQEALYQLIWLRDAERDSSAGDTLSAGAIAVRQYLEESGVDPDMLLAEIEAFNRDIAVWNETLVEDLDGRDVQIAGYALPLEFSETEIAS